METAPAPIIIVSGNVDTREVATTFRAIAAGAVAVVARPRGLGHPDHAATARDLVQTVKLMAEVKVVRRWASHTPSSPPGTPDPPAARPGAGPGAFDLVVIGASTGGPAAVSQILAGLPATFAVPVVIVQHIAAGFTQGLVDWLALTAAGPVELATQGLALRAGHVYLAPEGVHLGVGRACVVP
jgi:two-component system, chemotaxis family, protein-glutamate methylesterase/glutaminase